MRTELMSIGTTVQTISKLVNTGKSILAISHLR